MDTLAQHLTPDLAAREKAAELAIAHDKAMSEEADAPASMSDEDYGKLELAAKLAEQAYGSHGLRVMSGPDGKPFRCPNCNCPILEEDLEEEIEE